MDCRHRSQWVGRRIKPLFGERIALRIDRPHVCLRYADTNADEARSFRAEREPDRRSTETTGNLFKGCFATDSRREKGVDDLAHP
jgi:hypothetical protein